jgi:hypothetical protein
MLKCLNELTTLIDKGLLTIFKEIYKLKIFQKLKSGAIKIDEVLDQYPTLKKISGFGMAGILLYIWLNMTFIGSFGYDFNFSDIIGALQGSYQIADLFVSPQGLMLMTLFGTGSLFGLSIPWLGRSLYNLTLAIIYNGYRLAKDMPTKDVYDKIKSNLVFKRI